MSPLRYPSAYALLSGLLLALSFPKADLSLLAWVALAPLLIVLVQRRARWRLFFYGYLAGIVFFAVTCYWVYDCMRIYGHLSPRAAGVVLALFVLVITAPFFGLFSWAVGELARRWQLGALLLVPFVWVAIEWLRTYFPFGGFPWNLLGYSLAAHTGWVQPAAYAGVYGLSFLVAGVNALVAAFWLAPSRRRGLPLVFIALALAVSWYAGRRLPPEPTTATALLVQTNLPQQEDFDPYWVYNHPGELDAIEQLTRQSVLAQPAPPALVVWPEVPVSLYFNHDPVIRARLLAIAQATRSYFLTGIIDYRQDVDGRQRPLNSAVLLSPNGELVAQFDKTHLVPFGEYMPLPRLALFEQLTQEVSEFRTGEEFDVMPSDHGRLSVFICYEAIFPRLVGRFVERESGAEVLVNISNDGWFGRSAALAQHLNIARVRAVETRRFLLRATNTGITAVIDPYGRIVAAAPQQERTVLVAGFAPRQTMTLYSRFCDWLPLLCALVTVPVLARQFWVEALEKAVSE